MQLIEFYSSVFHGATMSDFNFNQWLIPFSNFGLVTKVRSFKVSRKAFIFIRLSAVMPNMFVLR